MLSKPKPIGTKNVLPLVGKDVHQRELCI